MSPAAHHPIAKMPHPDTSGIDRDVDSFPNLSLDDRECVGWLCESIAAKDFAAGLSDFRLREEKGQGLLPVSFSRSWLFEHK